MIATVTVGRPSGSIKRKYSKFPDNMTILMVVGGKPDLANSDVELIDLSDQGRQCLKPDDFPGAEFGSVGAFVQGRVIVCGGYPYTSSCYNYNQEFGTWTQTTYLTDSRGFSASTFLNGLWWVTGGYNFPNFENYLSSTDLLNDINVFTPYFNLPDERSYHDVVSLDDNRTMLLGGQDPFTETFIYDLNSNTWTDGPSLITGRENTQAGLITFPNGTSMIVAAGGYRKQTTEFLNLDDLNVWHYGPDLPYDFMFGGASVQLEKTFLIVGGEADTGYLNTIWMFDPGNEEWTSLDQTLRRSRRTTTAFLVPDSFCQ